MRGGPFEKVTYTVEEKQEEVDRGIEGDRGMEGEKLRLEDERHERGQRSAHPIPVFQGRRAKICEHE